MFVLYYSYIAMGRLCACIYFFDIYRIIGVICFDYGRDVILPCIYIIVIIYYYIIDVFLSVLPTTRVLDLV